VGEYLVHVHPPIQGSPPPVPTFPGDVVPMWAAAQMILPSPAPQPSKQVRVNGAPAIIVNVLVIDFHRDEFDRRKDSWALEDLLGGDPPVSLAFDLANTVLRRIRYITRGPNLRPLDFTSTAWRLDYRTDAGEELPADPDRFRARVAGNTKVEVTVLTGDAWEAVWGLPSDFISQAWDDLLLDATSLLPEVGASITVANAALEAFSIWVLGVLAARSDIDPILWKWLSDRGDFYKDPSVSERFDVLLKVLTGTSLKDNGDLWEAYKNLRDARNSFSHTGTAIIGKRRKQVTSADAAGLVQKAGDIVTWIEKLLPESVRRRQPPETTVEIRLNLAPDDVESGPSSVADGDVPK
jgi:hypothetical protein